MPDVATPPVDPSDAPAAPPAARSGRRPLPALLALALVAAVAVGPGSALAQVPFDDIPENHWALDAVARVSGLGLINGFPDGTFRGGLTVSRYELALILDRLLVVLEQAADAEAAVGEDALRAIEQAVAELGAELTDLGRTVAEQDDALDALGRTVVEQETELDALGRTVVEQETELAALRAELERLRTELAAVQTRLEQLERAPVETPPAEPEAQAPTPEEPEPEEPEPEEPEPEEPEPEEPPPAEAAPEEPAPEEPEEPVQAEPGDEADAVPPPPAVATGPEAERADETPLAEPVVPEPAVSTERRSYVAVAVSNELNDRFGLRVTVGRDALIGPVGGRVSLDFGRQSSFFEGSLAFALHADYRFTAEAVAGYAGAGLGYQLRLSDRTGAASGPFFGVLVGGDYLLSPVVAIFVEATVDLYLNPAASAPPAYAYGSIYPTLALGARFRF